jgi:hypothetical protein
MHSTAARNRYHCGGARFFRRLPSGKDGTVLFGARRSVQMRVSYLNPWSTAHVHFKAAYQDEEQDLSSI